MRVHDGFRSINASQQAQDPRSILGFYKRALQLRKTHRDVFIHGTFRLVDPEDESIFAYLKEAPVDQQPPRRKALVVLNMSREARACPDLAMAMKCDLKDVALLMSTTRDGGAGLRERHPVLAAWEGRVYICKLCMLVTGFEEEMMRPSNGLVQPMTKGKNMTGAAGDGSETDK
ncbi:Alpha-glucosidase [Tolypocladium paradoxum]|uniref:Alpha-glucosidase n=1 Tax=Tolypocladium paradoxum TaxID=94208 RepID=A0A2S4KLG1_9HYPO|nr:Alpha-glucosidase [Tolypocladium paradoxum]